MHYEKLRKSVLLLKLNARLNVYAYCDVSGRCLVISFQECTYGSYGMEASLWWDSDKWRRSGSLLVQLVGDHSDNVALSGVLRMSKSWQLLCSTTRPTRQVLLLSARLSSSFQFEYSPLLDRHSTDHTVLFTPVWCWTSASCFKVTTDFNGLFCAAFSQPC